MGQHDSCTVVGTTVIIDSSQIESKNELARLIVHEFTHHFTVHEIKRFKPDDTGPVADWSMTGIFSFVWRTIIRNDREDVSKLIDLAVAKCVYPYVSKFGSRLSK